jgi:membrane dipeptidase
MPDLAMGEITSETRPLLTAKVIGHGSGFVDPADYRVIVDGIVYEPEFNPASGILSLQMTTALLGQGAATGSGNFHVVTFEGRNLYGAFARETVIFYIR